MITLAFIGDLGLCGGVPAGLESSFSAGTPEFARLLTTADIAIANLESPFSEQHVRGMVATTQTAPLVKALGIKLVTLANNHIADAGAAGIETTLRTMSRFDIQSVGAGLSLEEALRPAIVEAGGWRVGFLAFADGRPYTHRHVARRGAPGAAYIDERLVRNAITSLRPRVDLLCVVFHQGLNYVHFASPRQRHFARVAADAGADLVVGHHPHVLQGWERMGRTFVMHSIGEFLLDPAAGNVVEPRWNRARSLTCVLQVTAAQDGIREFRFVPFRRNERFELMPLSKVETRAFDAWMKEISLLYRNYRPSVYLAAASDGVVAHVAKVWRHHIRRGNFGYLFRSLARLRLRHLRIGAHFVMRRVVGRGKDHSRPMIHF